MNVKIRLLAVMTLIASLFAFVTSASARDYDYHPIGTPEFQQVWERTDRPVAELRVARTWIWGPGGYTGLLWEEYEEAEGRKRLVQYFDKSRMEMPLNDDADPDSPWFITQGLLATELMTGELQLGDTEFVPYLPADIPVAGDPENPLGPTYAVMGRFIGWEPRPTGSIIHQTLDREGNVDDDVRLARYGVIDAVYVQETGHNIASVFWSLMTSTGLVYENGQYVQGALFRDAFYAIGLPKTEAYWTRAVVAGVERDVLIQCFERRCLTYTPDNPEGWRVESGNIGQHYFHWRYRIIPGQKPIAPVAPTTVAVAANPATIDVGKTSTVTATVRGADNANVGAGISVTFSLAEEGDETVLGLPDDTTVETDAEGRASITVNGLDAGKGTVIASVTVNGTTISGRTTITVEPVPTLELTADPAVIGIHGEATLTATVLDAEGDPAPDGTPVRFTITSGVESGRLGRATEQLILATDGVAEATLVGRAAGEVTIRATATVEGRQVSDELTITVRDDVALTLASDADTIPRGGEFNITATATNYTGANIAGARFNIIVDVPGGCNPGDDWTNFFEVIAVNGGATEGINDTFECVDGVFQGYWGPPGGFTFAKGASAETIFTVEVKNTARLRVHTLTVEFVQLGAGDEGADLVLADAELTFTVTRPAPPS